MKDLIKKIEVFSDTDDLCEALMAEKNKLPSKDHYYYNEIRVHMEGMYELLLDIKKQYKAEKNESFTK